MDDWALLEEKKVYLGGYLQGKRREARILEQIQLLRGSKLFPSMQNDGMPKGSGYSDLSAYVALLDELVEELKEERLATIRAYDSIWRDVRQIKAEVEREVLERRYLMGEKWEKLAIEMNYNYSYVLKLHNKALEHFYMGAGGKSEGMRLGDMIG